jgi:hypothetical protein
MSDIESFQPGDRVRAGVDRSFVGHLVKTGENRFAYQNVRTDEWNVPLWAVADAKTGEVRWFLGADAVQADTR